MSYRVSVTRVTLEYFVVDVESDEMEDAQNENEATGMAKGQIKSDPSRHQLGQQNVAYITTSVQRY